MLHVCGRREVHTGFWWENLEERDHLEDLDGDRRIKIKGILKKEEGWECMEWINLAQDGKSGRLL